MTAEQSLREIPSLSHELVESLLNYLPRSPFFVKDEALRYVAVNQAMLDLCGINGRADIIGKTARDFFPEALWRRYETLDRQVMRTRRPITDQLDLSVSTRGDPIWILFGRWPVLDAQGEVRGVAAISRNLEAPDRGHPGAARLAPVVEHIKANLAAPLDVSELARRAGVSVSQLERDFLGLFGISPRGYLTKIRFEQALTMLQAGEPIVEIAHACGYADQSAFTRRFRAAVGMSPTEYKRALGLK